MYGRALCKPYLYTGVSVGIGLVNGIVRGKQIFNLEYESKRISTLGVALQAHVIGTPSSWFGFGLSAACNINPTRSFGSITLNVHFGSFN
jgi:hypothetical protein